MCDCADCRAAKTAKQPKFRMRPYFCDWSSNGDADTWDTSCGKAFLINDHETPEKAGMCYCCFCGGELRQHI